MIDAARRLANGEIATGAEIEVTVRSGALAGSRFAVVPRDHKTCNGSGRTVGEYDAAIQARRAVPCQCVDQQLRRATNTRGQDPLTYEIDFDTEEARRTARRALLAAALTTAKAAFDDLERRATADVQKYHDQAHANVRRAEELEQGFVELEAKAEAEQRMLGLARENRDLAERCLKGAKQTLVAQEATAREAACALDTAKRRAHIERENADGLWREAERVRKTSWEMRLAGARRAAEAIAADLVKLEGGNG